MALFGDDVAFHLPAILLERVDPDAATGEKVKDPVATSILLFPDGGLVKLALYSSFPVEEGVEGF